MVAVSKLIFRFVHLAGSNCHPLAIISPAKNLLQNSSQFTPSPSN
jgi:hypothetical protein